MSRILPEFQKYIAECKLSSENQIPFYAGWASKFIRLSNDQHVKPNELKIQLFLDHLKKDSKGGAARGRASFKISIQFRSTKLPFLHCVSCLPGSNLQF